MKKMMLTLMAMLTIAVSANAMPYEQARTQALFLTDKMAYELNLTDAQYEAAYEINLDYLMSVATVDDVFSLYWERRNLDLSYILFSWQWDMFRAATYFYRPLYWDAGFWHFRIYTRYPHRDYFYFGRPHFYASYRGGHSWRMNGGRSFYEGHRDHYRPGPGHREQHSGMRDGWDRGDYRHNHGDRSSTRITAGHNDGGHNHGSRSDRGGRDYNNGNMGGGRDHNNNGNMGGGRDHNNNGNMGGGRDHNNNGNMGGGLDHNSGNSGSRMNDGHGYKIENVPVQRMNSNSSQRMNTMPAHRETGAPTQVRSGHDRGSSMGGGSHDRGGSVNRGGGSHSSGSMSSGSSHTRGGSMSSGSSHSRGGSGGGGRSGGGRSGGGHRR